MMPALLMLTAACQTWTDVDLAAAMSTVQPGDLIRVEQRDGGRRSFTVTAVTPPDLIAGGEYVVHVADLVRLELRSTSVVKTAGAVVGGAIVYAAALTLVAGIVLIALLP